MKLDQSHISLLDGVSACRRASLRLFVSPLLAACHPHSPHPFSRKSSSAEAELSVSPAQEAEQSSRHRVPTTWAAWRERESQMHRLQQTYGFPLLPSCRHSVRDWGGTCWLNVNVLKAGETRTGLMCMFADFQNQPSSSYYLQGFSHFYFFTKSLQACANLTLKYNHVFVLPHKS